MYVAGLHGVLHRGTCDIAAVQLAFNLEMR